MNAELVQVEGRVSGQQGMTVKAHPSGQMHQGVRHGRHSDWLAQAAGVLVSAVLLWDVLYRGQLGVSLMFLEEMYARNLGHLFVSPLRPYELVLSLLVMSIIRTLLLED